MVVGIKDVAKHAGVSPATVSRVLSGGTVSQHLRQRVEEAIQQTRYRPNLVARRLRANKSDTIALLIADIRNPFFTAIARAIDDIAQQSGKRLILCNTDENAERELSYLRLMEEEHVSGIIIAATHATLKDPKRLPQNTPVVFLDRSIDTLNHDCVSINNFGATAKLTQYLHDKGCKRISCLYGATSITGGQRKQAYEKTMSVLGLKAQTIAAPHDKHLLHNVFKKFIQDDQLPDGIIVTNGLLMLRFTEFLMQQNIKVPDDLLLTGFDDEAWTRLVFGGLNVIQQPVQAMAGHAMDCLKKRIENPNLPANKIILESSFIERDLRNS